MKITQAFLKKPSNHNTLKGRPMLFAVMPVAIMEGGTAKISYNIGTGQWFVAGQKGNTGGYFIKSYKRALLLMLTINHFNKTGVIKEFKHPEGQKLILKP